MVTMTTHQIQTLLAFKDTSYLHNFMFHYFSAETVFSDPHTHNSHFARMSKFYTKSDLTNPMCKNQGSSHKIPNTWLLQKNLNTSNRWS